MKRIGVLLLALVFITGAAESLKAVHKRNLMAESTYRFSELIPGLTDTVGCDAVRAQLLEIRAITDTTVAAMDVATRALWIKEIDTLVAAVNVKRINIKAIPIGEIER